MKNNFINEFCRYFFTFLVFVLPMCCAITSVAQIKTQQQKLDSLLIENEHYPRLDSNKLVLLRNVYRQYMRMKDVAGATQYANQSIALARKQNSKFFEAEAYYFLGRFNHGKTNYREAEVLYLKAVEKYREANNQSMVAGTYLDLGALYNGMPDYGKALEVNQKAIAIYQQINERVSLASCYTNVAEIYQSLDQQSNALNYLQKALAIFLAEGTDRGVAVVYNSIGEAYLTAADQELYKMGVSVAQKKEKALLNLQKGLSVARKLNDFTVLGPIYQDLGNVYEAMGSRTLAFNAYTQAIAYNKMDENKSALASSLLALGIFYEDDQQNKKAEDLLLGALKIGKQYQLLEIQRDAYFKLSEITEKRREFARSLHYHQQYIAFKDQIFNEDKEKEITRKQLQLDFSIKERDYQLQQQLTNGELQRQVLLAKQQQQQLVLRQQQLAISNQEKSLQRLTFLKKQADLENQQSFQSHLLNQQQLKAKLGQEIKDKQISLQKNQLRFNRNVNIFLGILLAVLLASGIFAYNAHRKSVKLNQLVSQQKTELENLSRVKDRIFSVVSHDMRSPINSLISLIQLLEDGDISLDKLKKYAGSLKHTLGYTSAMMENLLNWASSQMQGFKPVTEKFDLHFSVQEVINGLIAGAVQKKIGLHNELQSGTLCCADMNMTSLVLRNLIGNAIKFTPAQGTIKVSAQLFAQQIAIVIADTGVGMTEKQISDFNNLNHHQPVKSTIGTNQEKGMGIGLVLCKTFTTMMGGNLNAKSKPGEGTTFTLSLPSICQES
jgi:signal transduction histidine kinase